MELNFDICEDESGNFKSQSRKWEGSEVLIFEASRGSSP